MTGFKAYKLVQTRFQILKRAAAVISAGPDQLASQVSAVLDLLKKAEKSRDKLLRKLAVLELNTALENLDQVEGVNLLTKIIEESDLDTLRMIADRFRQQVPEQGIVVLGTVIDGSPRLITAVTEDLIKEGIKAGDLIKHVAQQVGGGGGGRPNLAEAGGKDPEKLPEALDSVVDWIRKQKE